MSRPTPTAIKIATGNPGKRPINDSEPTPARGHPARPSHVKGEAKKEWDRITDELDQMGLLTTADRPALAMYCITWARWQEAEKEVARMGAIVAAPKTKVPMHNPYLAVANTAAAQCLKLLQEFGLTPAARTKVRVGRSEEPIEPGELIY